MKMIRWLYVLLLALVPGYASAQTYPDRPITYVVPFQAGSSLDLVARIVAERLSAALGQPVVVDNRAGAGGNVGANLVAKAKPDGYTFLHTINSLAAGPGLTPDLPFDPVKDLAPVVGVAAQPFILVVNPSSPYKTVQDLIAAAKARPEKVSYGSSGVGSLDHLAAELFNSMAGTKMLHVPFRGGPAVLLDITGGRLDAAFTGIGGGAPQVLAGTLRALAVTSTKRNDLLPNVPTLAETIPGFEVVNASAIYAPANTPPAIIERINTEVNKILNAPDTREKLTKMGLSPTGGSAKELGDITKHDVATWTELIKKAGITAQQ